VSFLVVWLDGKIEQYTFAENLSISYIFDREGYLTVEKYLLINKKIIDISKEKGFELVVVIVDVSFYLFINNIYLYLYIISIENR
jgi:hypothetical protein